jgi:NDP-sugar pyrophosphorylase family protein
VKAVVLAAGLGTRLGELTADSAKGALDVGGRPLVAHVVAHLVRCGFVEVAVNLHYRAEQVREALDDPALGARIHWFPEQELLGTAGALAPMRSFLGDDAFVVHYGDVLTDHDLGALAEAHKRHDALLTLLVHERPSSNSIVEFEDGGRVTRFVERPSVGERAGASSQWVNSGICVCSPEVLELVPPPPPPSDLARDIVPVAVQSGRVFAETLSGYRCAVDSPERLEEARRALAEHRWCPPLD